MSDHDKFKDFVPQGRGFEIPARTAAFNQLLVLNAKFKEEAINWAEQMMSATDLEGLKQSLDGTDGLGKPLSLSPCFEDSAPRPIKIGEADAATFSFMSEPSDEEKYLVISAELFKDGSPYVPEELVDEGVENSDVFIAISPEPEEPPFMVNFDEMEAELARAGKAPGSPGEYKQIKIKKGEHVTEISDEECTSLVRTMSQLSIDPSYTIISGQTLRKTA